MDFSGGNEAGEMELVESFFPSKIFEVVVNFVSEHLHDCRFSLLDAIYFLAFLDRSIWNQHYIVMILCEPDVLVVFFQHQTVHFMEISYRQELVTPVSLVHHIPLKILREQSFVPTQDKV